MYVDDDGQTLPAAQLTAKHGWTADQIPDWYADRNRVFDGDAETYLGTRGQRVVAGLTVRDVYDIARRVAVNLGYTANEADEAAVDGCDLVEKYMGVWHVGDPDAERGVDEQRPPIPVPDPALVSYLQTLGESPRGDEPDAVLADRDLIAAYVGRQNPEHRPQSMLDSLDRVAINDGSVTIFAPAAVAGVTGPNDTDAGGGTVGGPWGRVEIMDDAAAAEGLATAAAEATPPPEPTLTGDPGE